MNRNYLSSFHLLREHSQLEGHIIIASVRAKTNDVLAIFSASIFCQECFCSLNFELFYILDIIVYHRSNQISLCLLPTFNSIIS